MKSIRSLFPAAVLLSGPILGGCVSAPKIEIEKETAATLKRIAVLDIHEPHNFQVANLGGAAAAFGIAGALVQVSTNADHAKQFVAVLKERRISFAADLQAAVVKALQADGFQVSLAPGQHPRLAADGKTLDYSDVRVDADAFLNVSYFQIGYFSDQWSSQYFPSVAVRVRLIDAKSKIDLYYKTVWIGHKLPIKNIVYLDPNPKYRYGSFDALMQAEEEAVAGLMDSQAAVASEIGDELRPR